MQKLFLFSFLVTTAVVHGEFLDIDLHKQNAQLKKVQELSEISAKIDEKQARFDVWKNQFRGLFDTEEKFKALEKPCNAFFQKFQKSFCEKKDVRGLLTEAFSDESDYELSFVKVLFVRMYFEMMLIKNLVEHYEKCLQEFIEIDENPC